MKRIIFFLAFVMPMTASANKFKIDGIYYYLYLGLDNVAYVTSGDEKYTGSVNIPETVNYKGFHYNVTMIESDAFRGCSGLTSVTIPNSVTEIDAYAFYGCSDLTSVTIGKRVKWISKSAFERCSGLTSITIPESVTIIGDNAFSGCSGLTSVHISDLAAWCKISFGDNSLSHAHHLFMNGKEIKDLVIPNSVTSIGKSAFYGCSSLTSVTIPSSVTSIGINAFAYCSGLTSVHISDLAAWCKISFGDNPLSHAHHLFMNGKEIKDLVIPNSVTSIGNSAFYGCSGLTSVTIPNSVTSIGINAFAYCSGLTSITIPNSVTSIGGTAFYGCSGLRSVTIPSSITSIGNGVFRGCSGLRSVTCEATSVPSTGNDVFNNVPLSSAKLYVPIDSINAYRTTAPWSSFGMIKAISIKYGDIYYEFNKTTKQATVVSGDEKYTGSVTIPQTVTYDGVTYSVTSIGEQAFYGCSGLTSVTIPNSVTSIGGRAFYGCSGLTSVTIPNSVTSIGEYAFFGCSGLTSVTIPNSVTSIGSSTFYNCSGLTSIDIPNSVIEIGSDAFYNCSGLTSIDIPNSVTSIGSYAFRNCSGLTSVTIPDNVTSIGSYAFRNCSGLTSIIVGSGNTKYDSRGNCNAIIETATNKLIKGCQNTIIPYSVTSIGYEAFNGCSGLTSITIPYSVTSIGESAFSGCSGLENVYCNAEDVPSTGSYVFASSSIANATLYVPSASIEAYKKTSPWSGFGTIKAVIINYDGIYYEFNKTTKKAIVVSGDEKYTGSVNIPETVTHNGVNYCVTSIKGSAFQGCSGLTSVTIPNSVTEIEESTFYGCSSLTSITIPNSVLSIGNSAFSGCSGLTSITIPYSVTSIGESAFSGCSGLENVYCNAEDVPSTGSSVFASSSIANATLYVPSASANAYKMTSPWSGFGTIKAFIISYDGIYYGFNKTTKQATVISGDEKYTGNVNIPETVTHNGVNYCVTSIKGSAFYGCSGLTSVTIPDNVTSIGEKAFYNCKGLTSVTIPDCVTSIGDNAFSNCSGLTSVHISDLAAWCKISFGDNPLYYAKHLFMDGNEIKDLVIPNSVTSIGDNAFSNCSGLTSITIPNSVTSIGDNAFSNCSGLTSITIPNSVTSIGNSAFRNCSGLTSVAIPNSVTSIFWHAFRNCSGLTSIVVESGNTKYDSRDNCNAIIETETNTLVVGCKNTIIPNSVTSIRQYAFYGSRGLTSVTIPNSVTSIENSAFEGCSGLTSVTIPNSVTIIRESTFYGCSSLTSVTIPNNVRYIGYSAFRNCSGLTSVTCEAKSVPTTESDAFYNVAMNSATLYVPSASINAYKKTSPWSGFGTIKADVINYDGIYYEFSKTTKQATVVSGDEKYTGSVNIPETVTYNGETYSVTSIGRYAFYGCSGLTSVIIGNNVTEIGYMAFYGCSGLTSVIIGNNVTEIGYSAFYGCSSLTSIIVGSGNTKYDSRGNCNAIIETATNKLIKGCQNTIIPYSVTSIGYEAFSGCSGLNSITIPYSVTSIGEYAFDDCSGLTSITIPNSVRYIGNSAFRNCSGLTSVTIPNSVTSIGYEAFYNCSGLKSVTIGNSVTSIGECAFDDCSGLTSITIPNSVRYIGNSAFRNCSGLTSVTIPNSVTSIGYEAFYNCSGLKSVTIGNSVTSIGECAFEDCSGLTSVTIGNNVTSIGEEAFDCCRSLISVICKATSVPSTGNDVFYYVPLSSAKLYVPASALDAYKAKSPWSKFGNILALPDDVRGDVNGDGKVDMDDVTFVTNIILDTEVATEAADVNGDGKVGMQDVMFIVNYIKNGKFPDE